MAEGEDDVFLSEDELEKVVWSIFVSSIFFLSFLIISSLGLSQLMEYAAIALNLMCFSALCVAP